MKDIRVLSQSKSDDEWYTPRNVIEDIVKSLDKSKIYWLPFDTKQSEFYKVLSENNFNVINSHISIGQDFYQYEPEQWDCIISNPPFKNKRLILERCLSFKKEFILIMGCSMFMQNGLSNVLNQCEFDFINKPVIYKNNKNETKKFLSCWVKNKK